ncbi:MAG: ATP-binding protein, partial [Acidimicrobiales bacterium]
MSGDALGPAALQQLAFVGRLDELTRLGDLGDLAVEQGAQMVLLSGDAGIGKSTLTTQFLEQLTEAGWGTHIGHCIEYADRSLPFGPVVALMRSVLLDNLEHVDLLVGHHRDDLAGLLPELGGEADTASFAGDVDRLFDAIASTIIQAANRRPLALVIEDVHWADAATRDVIASLVHSLGKARVLLIVTERSAAVEKTHPLRTWLAEQRRFPNVHSLELEGLGQAELAEQAESILGESPAPKFVAHLLERTAGNPYFAHELLVAKAAGSDELPTSLKEFLTSRLELLGEDERAV